MQRSTLIFPVIIVTVFLTSWSAAAQHNNARLFIEPNVSLEYDSNTFKAQDLFSNSYHRSSTHVLRCRPTDARIGITAETSSEIQDADSLVSQMISFASGNENDTIKFLHKPALIRCNGFTGFGMNTLVNGKHDVSMFYFVKWFEGGSCNVMYTSEKAKTGEFERDSLMIILLLNNITTHTKSELESDAASQQGKYTIKVIPVEYVPGSGHIYNAGFNGEVIIEPKPQLPVKEIRVGKNGIYMITYPHSSGKYYITWKNRNKGIHEMEGTLILLHKSGKEIPVPFTFSYENK